MLCSGITFIAFTLLHISCLYITREQTMCGTRKHSLWRFSSVATPPEIPICSIPFKNLWIYHPTPPWNFHWPLIFSGTAQSIIILLFCYYSSILKTESRSVDWVKDFVNIKLDPLCERGSASWVWRIPYAVTTKKQVHVHVMWIFISCCLTTICLPKVILHMQMLLINFAFSLNIFTLPESSEFIGFWPVTFGNSRPNIPQLSCSLHFRVMIIFR